MINAIIIEDEKPAMEVMVKILSQVSTKVEIKARLSSVKEGVEYFSGTQDADIIFSDVQLSDGLSFDIFARTSVHIPVIFITGYDRYMMMAFENNGIDYLLKPVDKNDVEKALLKYNSLRSHFLNSSENVPLDNLAKFINRRKKTRLLVKKGVDHVTILLEDIPLIYTQNKIVYVIDRFSKKYFYDKTLSELEEELDNNIFFRVNRQCIININFVKSFKPFEKVKLLLDLNIAQMDNPITISQETAPAFRKWMHDA